MVTDKTDHLPTVLQAHYCPPPPKMKMLESLNVPAMKFIG